MRSRPWGPQKRGECSRHANGESAAPSSALASPLWAPLVGPPRGRREFQRPQSLKPPLAVCVRRCFSPPLPAVSAFERFSSACVPRKSSTLPAPFPSRSARRQAATAQREEPCGLTARSGVTSRVQF